LELFGYSTDAALFVSRHPSSSEPHGHRLTPEGEYMHEEHRYTPDDFEPTIEPASADDLPGITDHVLGAQLKYTDRVELERAKRRAPETEQSRAVQAQLMEAKKKTFLLETTKIDGKSLRDVIDHL